MSKLVEIVLRPEDAVLDEQIKQAIKAQTSYQSFDFQYRIKRRSIDARGRQVLVRMGVEVFDKGELLPSLLAHHKEIYNPANNSKHQVVIIGAGPAGLFAALRLLEYGIKPIVIERGKDVRARRRDLAAINKNHVVNPESNYCFGEGGAGTYSDGKLYTVLKSVAISVKYLKCLWRMVQRKIYLWMHIRTLVPINYRCWLQTFVKQSKLMAEKYCLIHA